MKGMLEMGEKIRETYKHNLSRRLVEQKKSN